MARKEECYTCKYSEFRAGGFGKGNYLHSIFFCKKLEIQTKSDFWCKNFTSQWEVIAQWQAQKEERKAKRREYAKKYKQKATAREAKERAENLVQEQLHGA
jgi:hypothetical protein